MSPNIKIRPVEEVPTDSAVCHYDELEEGAKERFPHLATSNGAVSIDHSTATELSAVDLVKYTDYYAVSVT